MSSSVKAFYAVVDHTGTCLINPQGVTRLQMHSANLVIAKRVSRDAERFEVIKDRWQTSMDLFGVPGVSLTQEQADKIVAEHVAIALKYRRA
jgi:hypothetical protein